MKKIVSIILFIILFIPSIISAKELNIYLFYGDGCPHCESEREFLNEYLKKEQDIILHKYEIWYNSENKKLFNSINKILDTSSTGVPTLIIGDTVITGFSSGITEERIISAINYYKNINFEDKVGIFLGVVSKEENSSSTQSPSYEDTKFNVPLLGKIDAQKTSLILVSIVMGLVDGFNPCAMWILIFLISMLFTMKNKKRMWVLGITFLCTSALVYFLFMISWLNLAMFLNKIIYIRILISIISIIFGFYAIITFIKSLKKDDGCEIVSNKNRKKIITKIQKIIKEKSFILSLIGIMVLAAMVNIIELLCSLGLPVMFTQILALNHLSNSNQLLFTLLYILFFLIDDIVIFIIAMKTFEIKVISNKYGKYSHLIGGVIMLIIGILILFKPEWIMFNF